MSIYIGLLLTVMILIVNGKISPSTIEQDVQTLTKLWKKIVQISPPIAVKSYATQCSIVTVCCPKEEKNIYTLYFDNLLDKQCLTKEAEQIPACASAVREINKIIDDPLSKIFSDAIDTNVAVPEIPINGKTQDERMRKICSKGELNALFCDRHNLKKFKSCQSKVFRSVAQENINDDKLYTKYVTQVKDDYIAQIENIAKAFPKDS